MFLRSFIHNFDGFCLFLILPDGISAQQAMAAVLLDCRVGEGKGSSVGEGKGTMRMRIERGRHRGGKGVGCLAAAATKYEEEVKGIRWG